MNSKHIVHILKAKCMDKCGQATGYDHTDLGGFVVSFLVFIFASTSVGVLKGLFCVYIKHGIRLLW